MCSLNICLWSSNNLAVSKHAVNILVEEYDNNHNICEKRLHFMQEQFKRYIYIYNVYYMMFLHIRVKAEGITFHSLQLS